MRIPIINTLGGNPPERFFDLIIDEDGKEWCEFKKGKLKTTIPLIEIEKQINRIRRATEP